MKSNERKGRTISIHMDSRNYFEFEGIVIDFNNQKLMGVKEGKYSPLIGESHLEVTRDREKKPPKMLHASSSPTGDTWFNANNQLLAYDHLIAIDTNTNNILGSTVSITAAYHIIPEKVESELAHCKSSVIALAEFWNVVEKPENFGWYKILQAIENNPQQFSGKIGLIVDSDLGNHEAFNQRKKPIFSNFYLPKNVTLTYGSDKGGAEQLSTKMIKYCHDLAADLYKDQKHYLVHLNNKGIQSVPDDFCSHFRQWDISNMKLRPFLK